ncbi:hypothetical protein ACOJQI_20790 [Bacillus salacetis]|uniref:hypothetical protein n=1 Tax=Bacillus salacetis TaxID=2315464 RepID=UPI003B9EFFF5
MFKTISGHTKKVDKGFELSYFNLSYRRKMIRTIWMTHPVPVVFILLRYVLDLNFTISLIITIIALVGNLLQLWYNYHMWNKYER